MKTRDTSVKGALKLSFLVIATLSFAILYIMTSQASLHLFSRLCQFKCCNMSPELAVFLLGGFKQTEVTVYLR
jgi:hypothetical protein